MTRGKSKVAATRHAKHEWSFRRKALAVTLSITLLGLGTPAVSFADSAADQQSKAVEAQETTSAVSAQEQAPASAEPAQQVVASTAALGGDAAVDSDVATDSKAEVDGAADNAATPASSENASGAVSKNEASTLASSDDPSSDKSGASTDKPSDSTEAASKDATEQIEATSGESGYYVYLYTKVVGNTAGLTLKVNDNGWYTIGRVWVDGISAPTSHSTGYVTSGDDYNKVISALQDPSKVELYGVNTINLEDIDWSVENQSTGLKTASGAVDYDTSNNYTWHLDGYVDFDKVGFGSILFHYKDKKTKAAIAEDKAVTAKATGKEFDFSNYKISIKGYTYVEAVPSSVVVEKGVKKEVTLYYTAKQGKVGYYLADPDATWTAPDNTVFTENQKWYYNYGFAKGDTVQVTDVEPFATGKAFIGWLDKERGSQSAAIREGGATITYIYDGAKTYTLDALWASLAVTGYKDTYDGKEHGLASVDIAINEGSDLAQQYQDQAKKFIKQGTVQYSTDGGETWSDVAPKYKDAGTHPVKVKVDVTVGDRIATLESTANIEIEPATLTVTTPSDSRPYNGQPLTAAGTIEGFVNGETAGFATTGSQTAVGESDNTYAIDWEAEGATAKESNYKIVEKLGKLTVTEHDGEVVATAGSYKGVYDGNPHGVDVAVAGLPEGYTVKTAGSSATATDVTDEAGVAANVDELVIVNAQGEDVTGKLNIKREPGSIVIEPATLTVTTPSDSRPYNGQPLTAAGTIEGFVNGETAGFATTGSQTAVGESDNTYAIDWEAEGATAKESNYKIVEKLGTLKVTPNTTSIVVTPKGGTKVYDGTPLESTGIDEIVGLPKGFALTAEVVGSVTDAGYAKAAIKSFVITNATGEDVTDQFANVATDEATLVVTPRPVTVASADATKVYDGTELVKHEAKVSDGELVEGEEFDYGFFGTQTDAGVSDNTFEAKPGNDATKLENYEITYDRGALTVTPAPYSVTTESATKVYDGTALTAGGKIEGLLEGETANLKVTGSQTKVGASENAYTIEWTGTAKESNYKLESESIGTLTVTAAPDSPTPDDQSKDQGVFNGVNSGLVQTGDATSAYGMAAIIAAAVAAFVSLLAVRRRKE